jgi:hypothetical protein
MEKKMKALTNYLTKEGVFKKEEYDPCVFKIKAGEYMVLNERERDKEIKEYIQETLWAFYPSFLAKKTGLPEKVFEALSEKYEDGNDAILALVEKTCGLDTFIKSAIEADGYGHFLAPYDGKEGRETVEGEDYFIYRIN